MRILLLGEYSNVHWNLAEGLRQLGHEVCVISDGDEWKNYHRDIDLSRHSTGRLDTARYIMRLLSLLPKMRNYDVVQIINPVFLSIIQSRRRAFFPAQYPKSLAASNIFLCSSKSFVGAILYLFYLVTNFWFFFLTRQMLAEIGQSFFSFLRRPRAKSYGRR